MAAAGREAQGLLLLTRSTTKPACRKAREYAIPNEGKRYRQAARYTPPTSCMGTFVRARPKLLLLQKKPGYVQRRASLTAVGRLAAEQTGKKKCIITATTPRGQRTSAPKPSCRLFSIASLEETASGFRCLAKNNHTARNKTKTRRAVNGQRSTVSSQRSAVSS